MSKNDSPLRHKCDQCVKTYSTKYSLAEHKKLHSNTGFVSCVICNKTFTRNSTLKRHYKSHTIEREFACSVCGKEFVQKSHLETHMFVHTKTSNYKCDVCRKMFCKSTGLKAHVEVRHGNEPRVACERNYSCGIGKCKKLFRYRSSRSYHRRVFHRALV